MKRYAIVLAVGVMLGGVAQSDAAIVLAENHADLGNPGSADGSYSQQDVFGAENFVLASAATVSSISHVGLHSITASQPTSMDWKIYTDDLGLPTLSGPLFEGNSVSYSTTVLVSGIFFGSYDLIRYEIATGNIPLEPGSYWVAFNNNNDVMNPGWTYSYSGALDGKYAMSGNAGSSWSQGDGDMAFRVEGTWGVSAPVPEPASLAIWSILALCGIGFRRHRRRKA